ncbi:hypothetical protein CH363_17875 [Leptospira haakeii]|uniref:Lipoprotein n=1 Tax=Leptospira haakeii TaxID=2023198 RepID=A0ABX4PKR1_9LEPT|nr:hypothetical protein CH363_17875 [Leptospira haakeii]PKA18741.1 hypothetical protein CH377_16410 [Leptospira haakeii]
MTIKHFLIILFMLLLIQCEGDGLTKDECLATAALIYSLEINDNTPQDQASNIALLRAISCKR